MTKMAAMPIYDKNPSNILFSETNKLISTWVAHAFEWEKLLQCHLKGKASKKLANGQNIDYSEKKENGPRASSAPALGLNTIIFKHVYWYMQQTQVSVYRTIGPLVFILLRKRFHGFS